MQFIKKLEEKMPFVFNKIFLSTENKNHFLNVELPDNDLLKIEEKTKIIIKLLDELDNEIPFSYYLNVYSSGTEKEIDFTKIKDHLNENVKIIFKNFFYDKKAIDGEIINIDEQKQELTFLFNKKGQFIKRIINLNDIETIKLSAKITKEKK